MTQKLILNGNLGSDAQVKDFSNGRSVIEFSVATTRTWKDTQGERKSETTWHNCKLFTKSDKTGAKDHLKKGRLFNFEGMIKYTKEEVELADGKTRTFMHAYVDVDNFTPLHYPDKKEN